MDGRVCHRWQHPEGIQYAVLLDNGNLLGRASPSENVKGQRGLNGQSPAVFEIDRAGNEVWAYRHDWLHHDHARLPNGNTLLLQWRPMTKAQTKKVKGGYNSPEHDSDQMLGDVLIEVNAQGEVVREWRSWEHLDVKQDVICPIDHRMEWTHGNSVSVNNDGHWVVSLRRIDTVVVIDPESGDIVWRWGRDVISHQHDANFLPNGNLLVFDNGVHRKGGAEFSQAVEYNPKKDEVVWRYVADPPFSFFTFMAGGAERQSNGNTLITQSQIGRFIEVTPSGEIVWEYVNPFYSYNDRLGGRMNIVFKIHRYGPDHPALEGLNLDPDQYSHLNHLYD
jgi:hypothetical protein